MTKNTYIYIHVCCINNYKYVFNNLIYCIKNSGLYDIIKEIRCCVLGDYDKSFFETDSKISIVKTSNDLSLYEAFTINKMHEDAFLEDFYVLYIHTKGVTKPNDVCVRSWTEYLCYFNIYKYELCLKLLDENNDTVGVNLQDRINEEVHYAGNFWWTKSTYLKKLSSVIFVNYNDPEFWLTKNKIGKYIGLWHSNCPHYSEIYEDYNYKNKEIIPYTFDYTSVEYIFTNYNNDVILLENASNLKFVCKFVNTNQIIDITSSVYTKTKYFDNYIYIPNYHVCRSIIFQDDGLYYYDGIETIFSVIDGKKVYNINEKDNILININEKKMYLDKSFIDIDNQLTNEINTEINVHEPSVCFVITLKYVRGYDSYIKIYVDNIQKFYKNSFVVIVDNNSVNINDIKIVLKQYKNIKIITNTSESKWEVGGYTFGLEWLIENKMLNYDYYIFSQDTFILHNKYDFNKLQRHNIQACSIVDHQERFEWHFQSEKEKILQQNNISYNNTDICFGCNCVIYKYKIIGFYDYIKNIHLTVKEDSQLLERVLGFFIKMLEPKNANVDGFWHHCNDPSYKYFIKLSRSKFGFEEENNGIPILKNNIITIKSFK